LAQAKNQEHPADLAGCFRRHLKLYVSDSAEQIRVPILVVHAENDAAIPLELDAGVDP